jgi:hypothetical protein
MGMNGCIEPPNPYDEEERRRHVLRSARRMSFLEAMVELVVGRGGSGRDVYGSCWRRGDGRWSDVVAVQ